MVCEVDGVVYGPNMIRELVARVAELEDHIRLEKANAHIQSSCGRDTEAVAVEAEIVARRGGGWYAVVEYPGPHVRPSSQQTTEKE